MSQSLIPSVTRFASMILLLLMVGIIPLSAQPQVPSLDHWKVHDLDRAQPSKVDPGPAGDTVLPPSDAIVLFDGSSLAHWETPQGGAPGWKVENGYAEVTPGAGSIQTKQPFGDMQIHVEWATPNSGEGQDSGNSGVYIMNKYEVQVLNSYENKTYPDGQASAVYGQYPPLVNASRPPGQWQTYDIIFRRPHFDAEGALLRPARITVFHNNILVQDNVVLTGPTGHKSRPPYEAHADKLPLLLQDHNEPVRYRSLWVRELPEDR